MSVEKMTCVDGSLERVVPPLVGLLDFGSPLSSA